MIKIGTIQKKKKGNKKKGGEEMAPKFKTAEK